MVRASLEEVGAARSIVLDEGNVILAGNGVTEAALAAGLTKVRIIDARGDELVAVRRRGLTELQKRALALFDNRTAELATWNDEQLRADLKAGLDFAPWFSDTELAALLGTAAGDDDELRASLSDRFGVPPFSVLDARQGYWQTRKRAWLALGIESDLGRAAAPGGSLRPAAKLGRDGTTVRGDGRGRETPRAGAGSSVFDPVLCELVYRWFCPAAGLVLDPFAGGSVRGIVAARLGRRYLGVDLRADQVAANEAQAARICPEAPPAWRVGDSRALATLADAVEADLVFTCPPYGDLERYSADPADVSRLAYPEFLAAYRAILAAAVDRLRPHRFICLVVGDFRDRHGYYRGFVGDTVAAVVAAGARLYNDAILVTALASLPLRTAKQFEVARKLGKTHQNVLVFCKGDPRRATAAVGPVEYGPLEQAV